MKKMLLLAALTLFAAASARSQLTLNTGDSVVLRFNSLPEVFISTDSYGTNAVGGVSFSLLDFEATNDVLQFELFEDSLNSAPMANVVAEQANDGTLGSIGAWADYQGLVRFTMVTGSVTIAQVTFFHQIPIDSATGERHQLVLAPQWGTNLVHLLVPCEGLTNSASTNAVPWRNHGKYVSTMAKVTRQLQRDGLITKQERSRIISAAARSDCGKKVKPPKPPKPPKPNHP
jgi:hypothetical protein